MSDKTEKQEEVLGKATTKRDHFFDGTDSDWTESKEKTFENEYIIKYNFSYEDN